MINPFSTNVPTMDEPGSWFLPPKCLKNTCRRVTFSVKMQVTHMINHWRGFVLKTSWKYFEVKFFFNNLPLPPPPMFSFFVSPEQSRVFPLFYHLFPNSEAYINAIFPEICWQGCSFSFSPSIAFIINATYKGLLEVTNKINGEKILLTFYVSD